MSVPSPFALILPSRPVNAAPTAISPTQYAFSLPASPAFTHIIVFLLPGTTLPPNTLAGVYVQFPSTVPEFKFLGAIGNEKQSAIFRVGGGQTTESGTQAVEGGSDQDVMTDIDTAAPNSIQNPAANVIIGVSMEPVESIQTQVAMLESSETTIAQSTALVLTKQQHQQRSPNSTKILAQRIIKNAFNFLASFAGSTGPGGEEVVPLKSFRAWWEKFERRVEADPTFLERESDG